MNNDRRTRITEAMEHLSLARETLEAVRDEEQEAYENLAESLQEGERGQKMEDALDTLDTVVSDLEDMESSLEDCKA